MRETFHEESALMIKKESAKKKYLIIKIIAITCFVLSAAWLFIAFFRMPTDGVNSNNLVLFLLQSFAPTIILFLIGLWLIIIKDKICVDYDYTIVSGSVRIAKVINDVKRKPVIKFSNENIDKIGKLNSETYQNYKKTPNIKEVYLTKNMIPEDGKGMRKFRALQRKDYRRGNMEAFIWCDLSCGKRC